MLMGDRNILEELKERALVCDGAMGTMLYSKGVPSTRCYEELNLVEPEIVKSIHREYIDAGADIIETNTFGANSLKLRKYELENRVYDINRRGAEIAREVAGKVFVAGSVGPLIRPLDIETGDKGEDCFGEQIKGLVDGGVDAIMIETMSDLDDVVKALETAKSTGIPVICQMAYGRDKKTISGIPCKVATDRLASLGADVVGANCGVGPGDMLEIVKDISSTGVMFSVQPNAGFPRFINGRFVYPSTPEYFAMYAKKFVELGANIVGGCCGTTPEHIKAIAETIKGSKPQKKTWQPAQDDEPPQSVHYKPSRFLMSFEVSPPRGIDISGVLGICRRLKELGIDSVDVTDSPMGRPRMDPVISAYIIKRETGIEPVFHYTCRDKNLLALQAGLLGAHALGLRKVLALTGDPPNVSDYPFATGVFNVTSKGLVRLISNLNTGLNFAGSPIGKPTSFFIGVGANFSLGDREVKNLGEKVCLGANFIQTQPVYDVGLFRQFVSSISSLNRPVIAGILPLRSYLQAEYLHNEVPGIEIPEEIRKRMREADKPEKEGLVIAQEIFSQIKDVVEGVCIMPPDGKTGIELIELLKDVD